MGNDVTYYKTGHSRKLCALPVPAFTISFGLLFVFIFLTLSFYQCRTNLCYYNHLDTPIALSQRWP